MQKTVLFFQTCLALLLLATCSCAGQKEEVPAAPVYNPAYVLTPKAFPRIYSGPKAVFMGDSITQFWNESGNGHPAFFSSNGYMCKGIAGQTTAQMLERFREDVVDKDPGCCLICAGTNDIAGNGNGGVSIANDIIAGNIAAMAAMAADAGIPVILCSLLPANVYNWNPDVHPADIIIALNALLKAIALEKGYTWVDYWTPLADEAKGLPAVYSTDGVHPIQAGYTVMEGIIRPVIESVLNP